MTTSARVKLRFLLLSIFIFSFEGFKSLALAENTNEEHHCAIELCGAPRENIDWMPQGAKLDPKIEKRVQRELDPLITELVKKHLMLRQNKLKSVNELASKVDSLELNPIERSLVNLGVISILFNKLSNEEMETFFVVDKEDGLQIDSSLFLNKFPELKVEKGESLIQALNAYLSSPQVKSSRQIDSHMPFNLFLNSLGLEDNEASTKQLAQAYLSTVDFFNQANVGSIISESKLRLLKKVQSKGLLSLSEKINFIELFLQIYKLKALLNADLLSKMMAPQLSSNEINSFVHLNQEVQKQLERLQSKKILKNTSLKIIEKFKRAVRSFVASGYTKSEKQSAEKMIASVRNAASDEISKQFPDLNPAKREQAQQAVLKIVLNWPLNQEQAFAQAESQLKLDIRDATEDSNELERALQNNTEAAAQWALILQDLGSEKQAEILNLDDLISAYTPSSPEDAAYKELNQLQLGWQTIKSPQFGIGILAHELGHIISYILNTHLTSVKSCTSEKHVLSNTLYDSNVPFYQAEEDWADEFSTSVMSRLTTVSIKPLNHACLGLGWNEYSRDYDSLTLINTLRGDSHSSSFYRLIQIQSKFGKIPQSCMKATGLSEKSNFFKSCLGKP